jgi:hypothetical protein
MRFDEINIIGDFLVRGATAPPGLALGFSGSEVTWISAQAGTVEGLGITGSNYVICQSVNTGNVGTDAATNGQRLKAAYATASNLYNGSSRVSVLITPGVYDMGNSPLNLTTTNVDLIGLSSDANDVTLTGGLSYILSLDANVDTALCNVTLDTNPSYLFIPSVIYAVDNNNNLGDYLRWDNVIVRGELFIDLGINSGFGNLNGEFRNMKVYNSTNPFYVINGDLNGIYDNIEFYSVGNERIIGSDGAVIYGTYSNIKAYGSGGAPITSIFDGNAGIDAHFDNIQIYKFAGSVFSGGLFTRGTFKNINISSGDNSFVVGVGYIDGTFDNIIIGTASQNVFKTDVGNISGTFSNIEINSANNTFYCLTSGDITGTYKNIIVKVPNAYSFYTSDGSVIGKFENIRLGNSGEGCFVGNTGTVSYEFNDIEIGDNLSDTFYGFNGLSGTFSNIKINSLDGPSFWSQGNVDGNFRNIKIGNANSGIFSPSNNLTGVFENITTGVINQSFAGPNGYVGATFSNIKIKEITGTSFISFSDFDATIKNLEVDKISGGFSLITTTDGGSIKGNYENIKIGTNDDGGAIFYADGSIIGNFSNITIGRCANLFQSNNNLRGTIKNIKIYDTDPGSTILYSTFDTDLIVDNFYIGGNNRFGAILYHGTNGSIKGTFSNFDINAAPGYFGYHSSIFGGGSFKNINIATVSIACGYGIYQGQPIIDGLNFVGSMGTGSYHGVIKNSKIDAQYLQRNENGITESRWPITLGNQGATAALVERCQFYSVAGTHSIRAANTGVSASIVFTVIGQSIDPNITNNISTPFNLTGSNGWNFY